MFYAIDVTLGQFLSVWYPVTARKTQTPEPLTPPRLLQGPWSLQYNKMWKQDTGLLGTSLVGTVVKNPPCTAGDVGSIPGLGTNIPHASEQLSLCTETQGPACHNEDPVCHS